MKNAALLLFPLVLFGLATQAKAEQISLSCSIASEGAPKQDIVLEIRDGRVRYGSDRSSLVAITSIAGSSLVANSGVIAFKQLFPASHVAWDWRVDRATGEITIRYINTGNGKQFLKKSGTCAGG